jgi:hypothetical protein
MSGQPPIVGSTGSPDQVVLAYLAEMKRAEIWANRQGKDGDYDWDAIRARLSRIREKFTTPRVIAQELAVGFGDPPQHDPDKTRVVEVKATRRDRALVVTMERIDGGMQFEDDPTDEPPLEMRHEHRLHLINGEWRLNSRVVNDLDGEPRIRGLL